MYAISILFLYVLTVSYSVTVLSASASVLAPIDESSGITFHQWLGSVTERINQTMHYQFDGTLLYMYVIKCMCVCHTYH